MKPARKYQNRNIWTSTGTSASKGLMVIISRHYAFNKQTSSISLPDGDDWNHRYLSHDLDGEQ
jgi:hypothetical protein